jgi:hypothetical protein
MKKIPMEHQVIDSSQFLFFMFRNKHCAMEGFDVFYFDFPFCFFFSLNILICMFFFSNDGGATIHQTNAEMAHKFKQIGDMLNLRSHIVGNKEISGPGDIEGHVGMV